MLRNSTAYKDISSPVSSFGHSFKIFLRLGIAQWLSVCLMKPKAATLIPSTKTTCSKLLPLKLFAHPHNVRIQPFFHRENVLSL